MPLQPLPPCSNSKPSSGVQAALRGYDYQLRVSILAALRIMCVNKQAKSVTLEPANEEDLEADIIGDGPGRIQTGTEIQGYKLIVQVKYSNSSALNVNGLSKLLNHGTERTPAKDHLNDLNNHYLLVTNNAVEGVIRGLSVDDFVQSADPNTFPASLHPLLTNKPEGRIAIYAGLTERLLELELDIILCQVLHIPALKREACLDVLVAEAKRRMLGSFKGVWGYNDLMETLRRFDGQMVSVPAQRQFVEPSNYAQMLRILEERHALLISGRSGIGKTTAATVICEMLRQEEDKPDIITVKPTEGARALRTPSSAEPVVYYIEDPWGQITRSNESDSWTQQLPGLLRHASAQRKYVITTRDDLHDDNDMKSLQRWRVTLGEEHYPAHIKAQLVDKRIAFLPFTQGEIAQQYRNTILTELTTPLEFDIFFSALQLEEPDAENAADIIRRLLANANREAMVDVVRRWLGKQEQAATVLVLWALLSACEEIPREQLYPLHRSLRNGIPGQFTLFNRTIDKLIAARYLHQSGTVIRFAHPGVRQAFRAYCSDPDVLDENTLQTLIACLLAEGEAGETWATEAAVRVVCVIRDELPFSAKTFRLLPQSAQAIDRFLEAQLLNRGNNLMAALRQAATAGSAHSPACDLARWFFGGETNELKNYQEGWQAPDVPEQWYQSVYANNLCHEVVYRFVREVMPYEPYPFDSGYLTLLDRLAPKVIDAFIDAAAEGVGADFRCGFPFILDGAVRDMPRFEPLLERAILNIQQRNNKLLPLAQAIQDHELDETAEELFYLQRDEPTGSGEILAAWVEVKRRQRAWDELCSRSVSHEIVTAWIRQIRFRGHDADATKEKQALLTLANAASPESQQSFWEYAFHHWDAVLSADVLRGMTASTPRAVRKIRIACALTYCPAMLSAELNAPTDDLHFLYTLADIAMSDRPSATTFHSSLSPDAATLYAALQQPLMLPEKLKQRLQQAAGQISPGYLACFAPLMAKNPCLPSGLLSHGLRQTMDNEEAIALARVAVAIPDRKAVEVALRHPRADARLIAFEALLAQAEIPLPPELLQVTQDKSHKMRTRLVEAIGATCIPAHKAALLSLIDDGWSNDTSYGQEIAFPVARAAVEALEKYPALSADDCQRLWRQSRATYDAGLRRSALKLAIAKGDAQFHHQLFNRALAEQNSDEIAALAQRAQVEAWIFAGVTAEGLLAMEPDIAVACCELLCLHGPLSGVTQTLERIAQHNTHLALVLLCAILLKTRDVSAATQLFGLLPQGHPARAFLDREVAIDNAMMSGLGDTLICMAVKTRLQNGSAG